MAKENSLEAKITRQMQALGIYQPAFDGAIHDLAVLKRETSRARKAWKATAPAGMAPSPLDPHYALIRQQERDILALEDALGLTPKALRRLKAASIVPENNTAVDAQGGSPAVSALLQSLKNQAATNAVVSKVDRADD